MIEFTKNKQTKFIDPKSTLIDVLKADGWVVKAEKKAEKKADEKKADK